MGVQFTDNVNFQFIKKLSELENQNLYLIADILNGEKQMFLSFKKVRTKHFYTIGYCSEWKDNIDQLDTIAEECRKTNIHNKRFLYSEMPQENNTKEQLELSFSEAAISKGNTDFEEI